MGGVVWPHRNPKGRGENVRTNKERYIHRIPTTKGRSQSSTWKERKTKGQLIQKKKQKVWEHM